MTTAAHTRMTRQRRVIRDEVASRKDHPTAREVYRAVSESLPKVSLGTVYRNLEVLSEAGVIRKLKTGGSEFRFDGDVSEHCHVRCVECDRIDDLMGVRVEAPEVGLHESAGYEIQGCRLEFVGVCPGCQSGAGDSEGPESGSTL